MNYLRKLCCLLLTLSLLLGSGVFAAADTKSPEIIGASAILIDVNTGDILYEKNIHEQHYPASCTKILTCIMALENLDLADYCPIDEETAFTIGSRIYLLEGERIKVEEVLYGLMLESANDAAVALAKMMAGTVDAFAEKMNEKAKELGATDSHFVNPNGLDDPEHVSTAYDLARIARYCMENETFRMYCSTYQHTIQATNLQDTRYLYNTNRLLYDNANKVMVNGVIRGCKYDGILGVKTGYTPEAGGCLVAAAERDGTTLLAVTMASTDMGRFADCIALLDYGFENYHSVKMASAGDGLGVVKVKRGAEKTVETALPSDVYATLPLDQSKSDVALSVDLEKKVKAPVAEGDPLGTATLTFKDGRTVEYDVVAAAAVDKGGILSIFGISNKTAHKIWMTLLILFLLFVAAVTGYVLYMRRKIRIKKQKKAERAAQRAAAAEKARLEKEFWRDYRDR